MLHEYIIDYSVPMIHQGNFKFEIKNLGKLGVLTRKDTAEFAWSFFSRYWEQMNMNKLK